MLHLLYRKFKLVFYLKAHKSNIIYIILLLCTLSCTKDRVQIINDYIPSSRIEINNFSLIKEQAYNGDPYYQYEYGILFYDGIGVIKSKKEAFNWFLKSANNGYPPAQYALGMQYYNGIGVVANFNEGCKWLIKASENGIKEAQIEVLSKCLK